jgi:hypothetical protein
LATLRKPVGGSRCCSLNVWRIFWAVSRIFGKKRSTASFSGTAVPLNRTITAASTAVFDHDRHGDTDLVGYAPRPHRRGVALHPSIVEKLHQLRTITRERIFFTSRATENFEQRFTLRGRRESEIDATRGRGEQRHSRARREALDGERAPVVGRFAHHHRRAGQRGDRDRPNDFFAEFVDVRTCDLRDPSLVVSNRPTGRAP